MASYVRQRLLHNALQLNFRPLAQRAEEVPLDGKWNYPEVTDSFLLRHRNLLHCSLLVVRGAQVA